MASQLKVARLERSGKRPRLTACGADSEQPVTLAAMARLLRWGAAAALCLACSPFPESFQEVQMNAVVKLLVDPQVSLIDAVADGAGQPGELPGGFRWTHKEGERNAPQDLPAGGVLVIAADRRMAHRAAAALVRAGNQPVYVFIPKNAEERSSLYALALRTEEAIRGEDS